MKKKKSLKSLENKLDRTLSDYVRQKAADDGGTARCITCGKLDYWKDMDCGHYIKRQYKSTRWDIRNLGIQCRKCNRFAGGRMDEFALHIIQNQGLEVLEELGRLKHTTRKWTREELEQEIQKYAQ